MIVYDVGTSAPCSAVSVLSQVADARRRTGPPGNRLVALPTPAFRDALRQPCLFGRRLHGFSDSGPTDFAMRTARNAGAMMR